MSATWGEERILYRQNKRPRRLEEISAQREKLDSWIEILARNYQRINAHYEIEFIFTNNRLHESVNDLHVRQVTASSAGALYKRFACLERDDLKPSLSKIPGEISSATSDLKDTRTRWKFERSNQGATKWGNVVPKLLKDSALHQLRAQGADIINILQESFKASGFRCWSLSYLWLKSIVLNDMGNISLISGELFKNFGKIHARNYRGSLRFSKGGIFAE
jgi:hypothetical protein